MDIAKELRRYLRVLIAWAWLIALGALIAGGINFVLALKAPPKYEATTTLMVGQLLKQANPDQMEIGLSDRLAVYYLELLRRQPVLEGVKKELQLDMPNEALASLVSARVVPSTAFIEISVVDTDPIRAVKLVNVFASNLIKQSPTAPENQQKDQREFVQKQMDELQAKIVAGRAKEQELTKSLDTASTASEIAEIKGQIKAQQDQIDGWQTNYTNLLRLTSAASPNSINVLEESSQSRRVKSINPIISGLIAGAIGGVIALFFAIILEYLDDRLKSEDDIKDRLKINVLGHISRKGIQAEGKETKVNRLAAQEYEVVCTNILYSEIFDNQRRALLLTTPGDIKEQANVAVNLATAMVSFEQSVLLVDADIKKPELHELLSLDNSSGFFETFYGSGYIDVEDTVLETAIPNLYLMPAGNDAPDSQQLLVIRPGTRKIYNLPHQEVPGDFVIFKCGNILTEKTTRLLAGNVTATIFLCEINQTRGQELKAAIEVVKRLKGEILGVITIQPEASRFRKLLKKYSKSA